MRTVLFAWVMSSVRPRCVSVVFNWCSVTLLEGSSVINVFSRVGIQPYCFIRLTCFSCLNCWCAQQASDQRLIAVKWLKVKDFADLNFLIWTFTVIMTYQYMILCVSGPYVSVCLAAAEVFLCRNVFALCVRAPCVCACLQRCYLHPGAWDKL